MKALELIINDIFYTIEPEKIDIILADLPDTYEDRRETLLMHFSRLNEVSAVNTFLVEELGSLGVKPILKKIGIPFSPNEPLKNLVKNWTSYRGLHLLTPRSRPYELAMRLKETATQVSSDIQSFEAIEVAAPELKQLLRFLSAYYLRDKYLSDKIESDEKFAQELVNMNFTELAGCIDEINICLIEPYNPNSTETVSVLDEKGAQLLWELVRLWNKLYNRFADDDKSNNGIKYCRTLIDLIDHWRGKQIDKKGIIPRGAIVVQSSIQNELGVSSVRFRDEFQKTVEVCGIISSSMDIGTTVLLTPDFNKKSIWGPDLKPLFDGPEWSNITISNNTMQKKNNTMQKKNNIIGLSNKNQVFISYSHKDYKLKDKIITHLGSLKYNNIQYWSDDIIEAGNRWNDEIRDAIHESQVFILLISKNFLNSDFIREKEIPEIIKKDSLVIPVLLDDCFWKSVEIIDERQIIPKEAKPLSKIDEKEHDEIFVNLANRILSFYRP